MKDLKNKHDNANNQIDDIQDDKNEDRDWADKAIDFITGFFDKVLWFWGVNEKGNPRIKDTKNFLKNNKIQYDDLDDTFTKLEENSKPKPPSEEIKDNANEIKKDIEFKEKLEKSETKNKYTEEASKNIDKFLKEKLDKLSNKVKELKENINEKLPNEEDIDKIIKNLDNLKSKNEVSKKDIDEMLKNIEQLSKGLDRKDPSDKDTPNDKEDTGNSDTTETNTNTGKNDKGGNSGNNGNTGNNSDSDGNSDNGNNSGEGNTDNGNDSGNNTPPEDSNTNEDTPEFPNPFPPRKTCPVPNPFPFPFPNPFKPNLGGKCYRIEVYDPLVLDLNKDNKISITSSKDSNVYFNHTNDGVNIKTSWIGKEDGILVIDKNGNGIIDNGNELFGNFTTKNNGDMANNGFEALKDYDTNGDLIIDYRDDKFSELRVWQDLNSDGISNKGELKTLKELGIKSLNLKYKDNKQIKDSIAQISSYETLDGKTHLLADINFDVDSVDTIISVDKKYIKDHLTGANVGGIGRVSDLAIASNINITLNAILYLYAKSTTKQEQLNLLDEMLFEWAKTDKNFNSYNIEILKANDISNSNNYDDVNVEVIRLTPSQARLLKKQIEDGLTNKALIQELEEMKPKIQIVSAMTGMDLSKIYYMGDKDLRNFLDNINTTYNNIKSDVYKILLPQTRLKEYINLIKLKIEDDFSLSYDVSEAINSFASLSKTNPKKPLPI
ncbi:hypothetical protein [Campylobacter ureolyticus]|uniref:hypothetical protein n=1 Tax=Campylobacter ureolyticus TaxID=827 RepID=UPI0022B54C88|nr:hypothetical protein [Campylobacter ureolyticus]MCZ6104387.1 hypothetical protein [Campylobacter ureolyticus]MCZ6135672.1 hypothetical protein [Campylobacter ureolyticus]